MNRKITTCQLCRKYTECENAYYDPVFGQFGFDFECFEQDYFTPDEIFTRTGVKWQESWPIYFLKWHGGEKYADHWVSKPLGQVNNIGGRYAGKVICALQPGPPPETGCPHCGQLYNRLITDFCPRCGACNDQPRAACPQCGATYEDFDGFGVLHCPKCGYCVHPSTETVDGKETCCVCGREIIRKEL
jgi:hypothetical protein